MLYGCIMCSASACAMLSCFWLSAASSSPTRRCGAGARNSAGTLPVVCAAARPRPGDKWHLDEVFIRILGVQHYLWRAVDQDGVILDILVQERRDGKAAKRFFRRLLKGLQYVPRVIVTDKLRSYGVAQRHLLPDVEHRQSRIDPHADENDRCNTSSPASKRRTSFPLTMHPRPLPSTPTPHGGHNLPRDPIGGVQCLAAGDVCLVCCMMRSIDQMGSTPSVRN